MEHFMQAIHLSRRRLISNPISNVPSPAEKNDPRSFLKRKKEIKTYIELYKVDHGGRSPQYVYFLYDYLRSRETTNGITARGQRGQASMAAHPSMYESKPEVKKAEVKKPEGQEAESS